MEIFSFSVFGIHIAPTYYGLAYALGFTAVYFTVKYSKLLSEALLESFMTWIFVGVILGGRLGYVLFYNLPYYLEHPIKVLAIYEGGMSFHGATIGAIFTLVLFSKKYSIPLLKLSDITLLSLPIGLGLGRIANYLNNELFGYNPYLGPFGMHVGRNIHFPSPLLEAFLEGFVLFLILFFVQKKSTTPGKITGTFLVSYSIFRIFAEFFRLPDIQLGYFFSYFTLGQILSLPMIIIGLYILLKNHQHA